MGINRRSALLGLTAASGLASWAFAPRIAKAETYTYDALGRLCTVAYPNGSSVTYAYDAAGNRTSVGRAGLGSGFSQVIQITGTGPVNLRTLANNAGYNGAQAATVIFEVGGGVTITGTAGAAASAGGIAIDTGIWPTASYAITLALVIKRGGIVRGGGGGGSDGGAFGMGGLGGGAGGDALHCRLPMHVMVQCGGELRGGGGGGGGGGCYVHSLYNPEIIDGGGGGGGGAPNGAAGPGGEPGGDGGQAGFPGSAGTVNGGGNFGSAGGNAGWGGAGGNYGAAGANGVTGFPNPGSSGGAGGYAVRKNGHAVSVTNSGVVSGAIG